MGTAPRHGETLQIPCPALPLLLLQHLALAASSKD
jgi:hypothetical protein